MKINVTFAKGSEQPMPLMRDVPFGHLVKTKRGIYAITTSGGAFLLTHGDVVDQAPWFAKAEAFLDEPVEVIGKIKGITFEVE